MTLAFIDGPVTVYQGDVLPTLRELPDESVHCVVTSPPYWGLRDYGTATWDGGDPECDHKIPGGGMKAGLNSDGHNVRYLTSEKAVPGDCRKCGAHRIDSQLGLEPTPELYIEHMVAVFRELRRVLRRDGTCWLNMGDGYASSPPGNKKSGVEKWATSGLHGHVSATYAATLDASVSQKRNTVTAGLKPKDLIGMPWRLAFALQADGWWLRSDIIWAKPNPMPESVTDRPTNAHEHIFLLTRSARYYYDAEAVREAAFYAGKTITLGEKSLSKGQANGKGIEPSGNGKADSVTVAAGRNLRNVWEIATEPYPDAHFATFPQAIPLRCIKAGTSEHGVCSVCGAPWRRIVDKKFVLDHYLTRTRPAIDHGSSRPRNDDKTGSYSTTTTGWLPTCTHEAPPVPATVLEPFAGSGTTLAVARRLGRRSIGIELNPSYIDLIRRRVSRSALPLLELIG